MECGKCVNLVGEKTSEVALRTAVKMTAKQCGFELVESTVYPDTENSQYVFIFETENMPEGLDLEKVRDTLESNLRRLILA